MQNWGGGTVLIGDNEKLRASTIQRLCSSAGCTVIGFASSMKDLLELSLRCIPTIAIIHFGLVEGGGLKEVNDLVTMCPNVSIVYLVESDDIRPTGHIHQSVDQRTINYRVCSESDVLDALADLISKARTPQTSGGWSISRKITTRVLSKTEALMVGYFGAGASNEEMAHLFGISVATAQVHRKRILGKLSLNRSPDLFAFAVLSGLTERSHLFELTKLRNNGSRNLIALQVVRQAGASFNAFGSAV